MKIESITIIAQMLQSENIEQRVKDNLMSILRMENEEQASKLRKFNLWNCVSKDGTRPVMCGIFHDKGYKVASDSHILAAVRENYPESYEGRIMARNGELLSGDFVYPQWRSVADMKYFPDEEILNIARAREIIKEYKTDKKSGIYESFLVKIMDRYMKMNIFETMTSFADSYRQDVRMCLRKDSSYSAVMFRYNEDMILGMPIRFNGENDRTKIYNY